MVRITEPGVLGPANKAASSKIKVSVVTGRAANESEKVMATHFRAKLVREV